MKKAHAAPVVLLMLAVVSACGSSAPTGATPLVAATASTTATPAPSAGITTGPAPSTALPGPTDTPLSTPARTASARPALEIIRSQVWTDYQGNARANVVFHNPSAVAVRVTNGAEATLLNSSGKVIREGTFYFLDGVGGGTGAFQADETIAATVCFTCEEALLTEPWTDVRFVTAIKPATDPWTYFPDVKASNVKVEFDGKRPIFDVTAKVKNTSTSTLSRLSVRVIVVDQDDHLIGAAEISAYDVGPGTTVDIDGYGIGETPAGPFEMEVSALGVNY